MIPGMSSMANMDKVNSDIIEGYVYQAILDSKTTEVCRSFNGLTYFYKFPDKGTLPYQAMPPLHHRCRSFVTPITKSYQELGLDPDSLTAGQKTLLAGGVPQTQSYAEWFNSQSDKVQREVLGATRYTAYKNGSIKINSFTSNGQRLTIKQLEKAGYDI